MLILLPEGWSRPPGYSLGVAAEGRQVYVAGLIGWLPDGSFPSDTMAGQVRQALINTVDVLAEAGAKPEHIVRQTWFITDRDAYLAGVKDVGAA
jgi:enamine deaminase RidA (YjgF/YER057c/UK114 family)